MCMSGDEDYWLFYDSKDRIARKDHQCSECGRTIHKGEKYNRAGGMTEYGFDWYKTCAHCGEASRWLEVVCSGWVFGARQEDLLDHVVGSESYLRSRPLTRLVRWMRAGWADRAGNLRPVEDVRAVTTEAVIAYKRQYDKAVA